ncbi:LTA synthase family protein [Paenibacillus aurantius]|uniref:LTA synthase family protein n=1 Tax=Paenibacillus aurantius TaxID=2918900 RepID=A0AA96RB34_9BACL|nr:LTA synthase family protein [Paenibacillus aurantius]WNQ09085.1 LTA synthase family protein [Paenibacillus aurantius]
MPRVRTAWKSPFVFFTVLMLLKIYLASFVLFGFQDAWMPLVTGIPPVWAAFGLVEWLSSRRKLLNYWWVSLLLTSVYFAAIMYYKYYGVIVTYHALQMANQLTQVKGSVTSLMHPYYLLVYADLVVMIVLYLAGSRRRSWEMAHRTERWRRGPAGVLLLSLLACFALIWPNRYSMNELKQTQQMGILNYEVFALFDTRKNWNFLDGNEELTPEAVMAFKGEETARPEQYWEAAKGRNVIVLQLESFQNFLLGLKIDGQEITPVMNKLMGESFYFPHVYQQVGQGNTSDAEFVVNTSFFIPPLDAAALEYADRELPSLPRLFREKGYQALTFHTNDVIFWNRGELYQALGFDRYYDKAFFGEEDTVHFGASDEVLYRKTAEELGRLKAEGKPFYAQVISMSAHHPFNLPEEKKRITLPERYHGSFVEEYLVSQNYADYAIGTFIEELKKQGLWDNSVLFVYGDHLGLPLYSMTKTDKALLKEMTGREYGYSDMMNIPLIIQAPGVTGPKQWPQLGGQVDFMPTIANLSGISLEGHPYFGQDLLNSTSNLLPQRYYLPSGSFFTGTAIFIPGKGFEDGTTFPLPYADEQSDPPTQEEYRKALELLELSDQYVNGLPLRSPSGSSANQQD